MHHHTQLKLRGFFGLVWFDFLCRTQAFKLSRQALYGLSHISNPETIFEAASI
jgi:hypothetical protein